MSDGTGQDGSVRIVSYIKALNEYFSSQVSTIYTNKLQVAKLMKLLKRPEKYKMENHENMITSRCNCSVFFFIGHKMFKIYLFIFMTYRAYKLRPLNITAKWLISIKNTLENLLLKY